VQRLLINIFYFIILKLLFDALMNRQKTKITCATSRVFMVYYY